MEPYFLKIAIDLILTPHPALMASLVRNSIVVVIQTLPSENPVSVPCINKSFLEGLGSQESRLMCAYSFQVQLCPKQGSVSSKPVLMEDRPSSHHLPAPLSASKFLSSFQISEREVTTETKGRADHPNSWWNHLHSLVQLCSLSPPPPPTYFPCCSLQNPNSKKKTTLWSHFSLSALPLTHPCKP